MHIHLQIHTMNSFTSCRSLVAQLDGEPPFAEDDEVEFSKILNLALNLQLAVKLSVVSRAPRRELGQVRISNLHATCHEEFPCPWCSAFAKEGICMVLCAGFDSLSSTEQSVPSCTCMFWACEEPNKNPTRSGHTDNAVYVLVEMHCCSH
jgi:hypothetical protein